MAYDSPQMVQNSRIRGKKKPTRASHPHAKVARRPIFVFFFDRFQQFCGCCKAVWVVFKEDLLLAQEEDLLLAQEDDLLLAQEKENLLLAQEEDPQEVWSSREISTPAGGCGEGFQGNLHTRRRV